MFHTGILLMSLFATPSLVVDGAAAADPPRAPGVHDVEVRLDGNRPARFTLALPDAPGAAPGVLVVVLHYAGQPTRFYGRPLVEDLFAPAWRELGAVFVAPESLGGQWHTEANEAFVMQLVETLQSAYTLDPARTVIAGYSMGAIGTWHFLAHYPARFAAAVPVAGFPSGALECPAPVRTLATESDEIFDFARLRAAVEAARARGCDIALQAVPARGHYDVGGFRDALATLLPWLQHTLDPDRAGASP